MIKNILSLVLKKPPVETRKELSIEYVVGKRPSQNMLGYKASDIETVAKRYESSSQNVNESNILSLSPVRDLDYFLKNDCIWFFNKLKQWRILDLGCGNGIYSKYFLSKNFDFGKVEYEGCEINKRFVEVCKKINPNIKFFISFADKIKAGDNSYDIVFSSSVLHYALDGWKASMKEHSRVSKRFVIITRFPLSKYQKTFYVCQKVTGPYGQESHHFIVINRKEFEDYLIKLKLKVVARDYSSEEYSINGISEKIMLVQYLLEKI